MTCFRLALSILIAASFTTMEPRADNRDKPNSVHAGRTGANLGEGKEHPAVRYALITLAQGRIRLGIQKVELARQTDPNNRALQQVLATLFFEQAGRDLMSANWRDADELLKKAMNLDQTRHDFYIAWAKSSYERRKLKLTKARLQEAINKFPTEPELHAFMGTVHRDMGNRREAIAHLQKANSLRPDDQGVAQFVGRLAREAQIESTHTRKKTNNFIFYYNPGLPQINGTVTTIQDHLEDGYTRATRFLQSPKLTRPIPVVLHDDQEFRFVTQLTEGFKGVFDGSLRIPIDEYTKDHEFSRRSLRHELVHAILTDYSNEIPVWLHEGLAQMIEGRSMVNTQAVLQQYGVANSQMISKSFTKLKNPKVISVLYAQSHFMAWALHEKFGVNGIKQYIDLMNQNPFRPQEWAFHRSFGISFGRFNQKIKTYVSIQKNKRDHHLPEQNPLANIPVPRQNPYGRAPASHQY